MYVIKLCKIKCILKISFLFILSIANVPTLHVSYKPQKISPKSVGSVRQLLHEKIREAYIHPQVSSK